MELSFNEAKQVCKADCPATADASKFERNIPQIRLACACWFELLGDLGFTTGEILLVRRTILSCGLYRVVKTAGDLAEEILNHSEDVASDLWGLSRTDTMVHYVIASYADRFNGDRRALLSNVLQALLFLERFTYIEGDPTDSVGKFRKVNSKCKEYEHNWDLWPKHTILSMVRQELSKILGDVPTVSLRDCGFTNGSTNQTPGDYLAKWQNLSKYYPNYKGCLEYPLPGGFSGTLRMRYPKLQPVPKSMTAYRIIAPEHPYLNYWATGYLAGLRRSLERTGAACYINERNQAINQQLAAEGSVTREWCTIDMSSASDSISKALFHAVAPSGWSQWITSVESYYVTMPDGATKKLYTLFTSGHPLTWLLEACYFLAIARTAVGMCFGEGSDQVCFAYGDDLVVPSEAYETLCELLELFGHTVNRKKSYAHGYFRESCGSWYYMGVDVTPIRWPRRPVTPDKGALACVCADIQKKAFGRFTRLSDGCTLLAKRFDPKITSSAPGLGCDDLWDASVDPLSSELRKHWHYGPVMRDRKRCDFLDHLVYYQYLEYGPLYMSDLDRLLGVSTSRFITYRTKGESSVTFS